jgi:hypothetical protein
MKSSWQAAFRATATIPRIFDRRPFYASRYSAIALDGAEGVSVNFRFQAQRFEGFDFGLSILGLPCVSDCDTVASWPRWILKAFTVGAIMRTDPNDRRFKKSESLTWVK